MWCITFSRSLKQMEAGAACIMGDMGHLLLGQPWISYKGHVSLMFARAGLVSHLLLLRIAWMHGWAALPLPAVCVICPTQRFYLVSLPFQRCWFGSGATCGNLFITGRARRWQKVLASGPRSLCGADWGRSWVWVKTNGTILG